MNIKKVKKELQKFANDHGVLFEHSGKGEVGMGRPCVGFERGGSYIHYRPLTHHDFNTAEKAPKYEDMLIFGHDPRLSPPKETPNAYHKHECLSVLIEAEDWENIPQESVDTALIELWHWMKHLEKQGELEVVEFETGATGIQAMVSGLTSWAIKYKGFPNE